MRKRRMKAQRLNSQRRIVPCKSRLVAYKHDPRQCCVGPATAAAGRQTPVYSVRIKWLMMDVAVDEPGKDAHVRFYHGDYATRNEDPAGFAQEGVHITHMVQHIDHHQSTGRGIGKWQSFTWQTLSMNGSSTTSVLIKSPTNWSRNPPPLPSSTRNPSGAAATIPASSRYQRCQQPVANGEPWIHV